MQLLAVEKTGVGEQTEPLATVSWRKKESGLIRFLVEDELGRLGLFASDYVGLNGLLNNAADVRHDRIKHLNALAILSIGRLRLWWS